MKLQRTFNCRIVIWDRTLLCRIVICLVFREFICDGCNNQQNAEEDLSSKDEALFFLFESANDCISAVAFNAVFAELICFVQVTGSNANNAKAWCETVGVEDTLTFTARD